MKKLLLFLLLLPVTLCGYTKIVSTFMTDGSWADFSAAVADAIGGELIAIPAGTYSNWGANGANVQVNKAITIYGAGKSATVVNGAANATTVFSVSAGATIKSFTFNGGGANTVIFNVTGTEGAYLGCRFTDLKLDFTGGLGSRMFYINRVYGLADNCEFVGGGTQNEFIYMRGPHDAWDYAAQPGTINAFYFEKNVFSGDGYPDANAAARMVFRNNTITSKIKFDAHGFASNLDPVRSARLFECYRNTWTYPASSWTAMEFRGGGLYCWGNRSYYNASTYWPNLYARDYGYDSGPWTNYSGIYQTPTNYPLPDQIGAGPGTVVANGHGTQVGGAEPAYFWDNATASASSPVDWQIHFKDSTAKTFTTDGASYPIGSKIINLAVAGSALTNGNWIAIAGDNNRYQLGVDHASGSLVLNLGAIGIAQAIPATPTVITYGAQTNYQGQTGNPSATFTTAANLIVADKDYFWGAYGWPAFDGSSGVGHGTKAQMLALNMTGKTKKVGFVVTDEADWDSTLPGTDGQLYQWDGVSAWTLNYTPFTYPHPLRASDPAPDVTAPTPNPATIASCTAIGVGSISVTATLATDSESSPVSYAFSSDNGSTYTSYQSSPTYIFTGLTDATTYQIKVKSQDAAGNVTTASSATACATPTAPAKVRGRGVGPQVNP